MQNGSHIQSLFVLLKNKIQSLVIREMQTEATHLSECLKSKIQEITGAGEDVEKGEPLNVVGGNANGCSHSGKQYGDSSKS